jgi:hypothetical protein
LRALSGYFKAIRCVLWQLGIFYSYCWDILRPFAEFFWKIGVFYSYLVSNMVIWYIFPVLVCRTEKNLATLPETSSPFIHSELSILFAELEVGRA